ncbi:MAG TPA: hypothetical protein VNO21_21355, partial [Polyangiaceae bacterium]|nr:hypothetical protein [Polyangiaceae bacterium]
MPRGELSSGTPFFFKLRGANAIVGFGFFAGFSILPAREAWATFGDANGVRSLSELRRQIRKIGNARGRSTDPQGRIGCTWIAEARFFPEKQWIPAPRDWKGGIVVGMQYDLGSGE